MVLASKEPSSGAFLNSVSSTRFRLGPQKRALRECPTRYCSAPTSDASSISNRRIITSTAHPFEAKSTYPQKAAGSSHSDSDECNAICGFSVQWNLCSSVPKSKTTTFKHQMTPPRSRIAILDPKPPSRKNPCKSVSIRVPFFTCAQSGCASHEVETRTGNDACDETKNSKPKTQNSARCDGSALFAMVSASICAICGFSVRWNPYSSVPKSKTTT